MLKRGQDYLYVNRQSVFVFQGSSSQTEEEEFSGGAWAAMKAEMGLDERNPACFLHTHSVVMVLRRVSSVIGVVPALRHKPDPHTVGPAGSPASSALLIFGSRSSKKRFTPPIVSSCEAAGGFSA